jgi:hypothetical protein
MRVPEWKNFNRGFTWGASIFALGLQACSLSPSKGDPSLYVDLSALENRGFRFSLLDSPTFLAGVTTAPPQYATGFSCYGVNVTGPGIPDTSPNPHGDPMLEFSRTLNLPERYCAYRGIVTPPLTVSQGAMDASLQVPPGSVRLVQVLGVTDPQVCSSGVLGREADDDAAGARYYELGRSVIRDMFSDQSVNIAVTWPSGVNDGLERQKRSMECGDNCTSFAQLLTGGITGSYSISNTSTKYGQRVGSIPGSYFKRVSLYLSGSSANVVTYPSVSATVKLYQATAGAATPASATVFTETIAVPTDGVGRWYSFELYDPTARYLQMQNGVDYWIVVYSSNAVTSNRVLGVGYVENLASVSTDTQLFNGSTWGTQTDTDGLMIKPMGCSN